MYPSSSSSSSQSQSGLTRYGSAPGSLLTNAVDAVIGGADREFSTTAVGSRPPVTHFFSGESSESSCKVNSSSDPKDKPPRLGLQRSYGLHDGAAIGFGSSSSALLRQRSSPAGFLSHLTAAPPDNGGFSISRGSGSYSAQGVSNSGHGISRLKSQLSFTGQESLSQISEVNENVDGINSDNGHHRATHSYATTSFGIETWDGSNSIVFSAPSSKRAKSIDGDILNCLNALESQFSLPQTTLEMAAVEKLLHIPEDSVPCKIRAKRGCATHPRSIAERERRTRISGKLKKLQELVPNMDKQTSYADMLDLAVQHIKGLQTQVQKLHKELENCTCGCKQSS
ncbi:transcription factor bHLH128-like [Prosopis cineraria]|uniref:transcription factor bHLH128-like n=1 Tax=Prosopis cineraria TaxID=364024 RepID=UPI0024108175|nr:transcription factor bHLH128-like [Prosopis cineraria]